MDKAKINFLLNNTKAGEIALKLDAQDGNSDHKISLSLWNDFAQKYGGKVREITDENQTIDAATAMNEIMQMAINKGAKEGKFVNDMANEMYSDLAVSFGNTAKTASTAASAATSTTKTANTKKVQTDKPKPHKLPKDLTEEEMKYLTYVSNEFAEQIQKYSINIKDIIPHDCPSIKKLTPKSFEFPKQTTFTGYGWDKPIGEKSNSFLGTIADLLFPNEAINRPDKDGRVTIGDHIYQYNDEGYISKMFLKDEKHPLLEIDRDYTGKIKRYNAIKYDKEGREIENYWMDNKGELQHYQHIEYLPEGNKIIIDASKNKINQVILRNANGFDIQVDDYRDNKIRHTRTFSEEEKGKEIAYGYYNNNGDLEAQIVNLPNSCSLKRDASGRIIDYTTKDDNGRYYISETEKGYHITSTLWGGEERDYHYEIDSAGNIIDTPRMNDFSLTEQDNNVSVIDYDGKPIYYTYSLHESDSNDPSNDIYMKIAYDMETKSFKYYQKVNLGFGERPYEKNKNGNVIVYDIEGKPYAIEGFDDAYYDPYKPSIQQNDD